jgi:hypothetical protein
MVDHEPEFTNDERLSSNFGARIFSELIDEIPPHMLVHGYESRESHWQRKLVIGRIGKLLETTRTTNGVPTQSSTDMVFTLVKLFCETDKTNPAFRFRGNYEGRGIFNTFVFRHKGLLSENKNAVMNLERERYQGYRQALLRTSARALNEYPKEDEPLIKVSDKMNRDFLESLAAESLGLIEFMIDSPRKKYITLAQRGIEIVRRWPQDFWGTYSEEI